MELWSNFIDIIIIGVGVYLIYLIFKAKKYGEIHKTFIWRRDDNPDRCRDKEGFVNYLFPRVVLCAVILIVNGVLGMINRSVMPFLPMYELVSIGITFVAIIIFGFSASSAMKNFFD